MKSQSHFFIALLLFICLWLQGCIHEYPHAVYNISIGEDPTKHAGYIEVNCQLSWEELLHEINFCTKALRNNRHRIIMEVRKNGETVCREEVLLNDEEFAEGYWTHRLSKPLESQTYLLAVWYDRLDSEGSHAYNAENSEFINATSFSTTDAENMVCAFSLEELDLRNPEEWESSEIFYKKVELSHAGAKFEIVASDVQEFIIQQKNALNQGDSFNVRLNFEESRFGNFNLLTGNTVSAESELSMEGWMRLPFDDYQELKIAEGFVFCGETDMAQMELCVINNSSLAIISRTSPFSIPLKRGHVTIVRGNFLTHGVNGMFSIDNIWEEDIIFEI